MSHDPAACPPALAVDACSPLEVQVITKPAGPMLHGVVCRRMDGSVLRQWISSDEDWLKHDLFSGPLAAQFWRETAPHGYTIISWNDSSANSALREEKNLWEAKYRESL